MKKLQVRCDDINYYIIYSLQAGLLYAKHYTIMQRKVQKLKKYAPPQEKTKQKKSTAVQIHEGKNPYD